ncbi:MAG TPA: protein kinase [Thermomicrobiales bacterium]|nr:protein kinase [Thermomicrobiales bacterium]
MSGFATSLIGLSLGGHTVRRVIARGGMGIVCEGIQESLGRRVAIKVMYPHLSEDATFRERFQREARAIAHLRHSNIVGVIDFGADQGYHFMVMELIDGPSLRDELARRHEQDRPLSAEDSLAILGAITSALTYAHQRGMIHRDVKPANVMLDEHGDVFLTDFGLVKLADPQNVTITGMIVGTPEYMAPEQSMGTADVTPAVDQYSLAVVAYQLLVGRTPFTAPTPVGVIQKHINELPPPPHTIVPTFPRAIERVLARGLSKDPGDRYPSVDAFFRELTSATRAALPASPPESAAARVPAPPWPLETTVVVPDDGEPDGRVEQTASTRLIDAELDDAPALRVTPSAMAVPMAGGAAHESLPPASARSVASSAGSGGYRQLPPDFFGAEGSPERGRMPIYFAIAAVALMLVAVSVATTLYVLGRDGSRRSGADSTSTALAAIPPAASAEPTQAVILVGATPTNAAARSATPSAAPASTPSAPMTATARVVGTEAPTATPTTASVRIHSPTPTRIVLAPVMPTVAGDSVPEGWTQLIYDEFEGPTEFYIGESSGGSGGTYSLQDGLYRVSVPENRWQTSSAVWLDPMSDGFIFARVSFEGDGRAGLSVRYRREDDGTASYYMCWLSSVGGAGCHQVEHGEFTHLSSVEQGTIELRSINTLAIQVDGTYMTLKVNSDDVLIAVDVGAEVGYWGMYAESFSGELTAWFDDVQLLVRAE